MFGKMPGDGANLRAAPAASAPHQHPRVLLSVAGELERRAGAPDFAARSLWPELDEWLRLRNGRLQPTEQQSVADAVLRLLSDRSSPDLRLQAVLALAEFTTIDGVQATLGGLALDASETIDIGYSAFTSLQRAGPTATCVALLRQLSTDGVLGRSARSLLALWRLR